MTSEAQASIRELEEYLRQGGFSGDIPQNSGHKNWQVIKRLMKNDPFYTFGIERIEAAVKSRQVNAKGIRQIMIEASGISIQRFRHRGAGHFSSNLVSRRLLEASIQIAKAAKAERTIIFATGHPGAMVGFLSELAAWAESLGAKIVAIDHAIKVEYGLSLDMIGPVFVPSDSCSAAHSHSDKMMSMLLSQQTADLVVADHGFAGAALNFNIPTIGFYDTDDPAIPLAQALGMKLLAVPINDNCFNADGATLARFMIERFGQSHATPQSRRSRTRTS